MWRRASLVFSSTHFISGLLSLRVLMFVVWVRLLSQGMGAIVGSVRGHFYLCGWAVRRFVRRVIRRGGYFGCVRCPGQGAPSGVIRTVLCLLSLILRAGSYVGFSAGGRFLRALSGARARGGGAGTSRCASY